MSGHSKWNNIKHKKEKSDAAKAKIFTKIGKEMAVAIKAGGPDPNTQDSELEETHYHAVLGSHFVETIHRSWNESESSNDCQDS